MTDIGFGLLDRRTVITVLFTLVLMQLLFGLQIPVDIKNVVQLFIDLVVLTGYIYLARTIYRLPVAAIVSTISSLKNIKILVKDLLDAIKKEKTELQQQLNSKKAKSIKTKLGIWYLSFLVISSPIIFIVIWLLSIFTFGEAIEKKYGTALITLPYFYHERKTFLDVVFGILDRIGIVAVAMLATVPSFNNYVKIIGVGGIIVMITLFTLRGDFTALLKDILEKKKETKEEDEEQKDSSVEVKNSRRSPMYVEIVNDEENPVKINNSKWQPFYVEFDSKGSKYGGLPVFVMGNSYPVSVNVENPVHISTSSSSPLHVEVENYSLSVDIENSTPVQVEVTNVVKTETNDDDSY